jgi:hypothetical protein
MKDDPVHLLRGVKALLPADKILVCVLALMECVHLVLQFLASAHSIYSRQHIPLFSDWGVINLRASRVKKMLIEKLLQGSVLLGLAHCPFRFFMIRMANGLPS